MSCDEMGHNEMKGGIVSPFFTIQTEHLWTPLNTFGPYLDTFHAVTFTE